MTLGFFDQKNTHMSRDPVSLDDDHYHFDYCGGLLKKSFVLIAIMAASVSCRATNKSQTLSDVGNEWDRALEAAKRQPCIPVFDGGVPAGIPTGPDELLTPGSLCQSAGIRRYPEQVNYCERKVSSAKKDSIFTMYANKGFSQVIAMPRSEFKIDHMISLCLGGSNEANNLWPQHSSINRYTDPIEPRLCVLLARGKITQAQAVQLIVDAKKNLNHTPDICADLDQQIQDGDTTQ